MKKSIFTVTLLWCWLSSCGLHVATCQESLKAPFVKGRVMDFVTRSPIGGARVLVEGGKWETYTDNKGEFELQGWKPGMYTLRITHAGYKPLLCKNFQIKEGGVYAGFVLKVGSPTDKPLIRDDRPLGQFVIDEDAEPIEKGEPVYPESAVRDKVEGTVLLNVNVNKEGDVVSAWVAQGVREDLNRAAMEAIQYFKFKPARVKGEPVGVPITIPFTFKLADRSSPIPLKQIEGPLTPDEIKAALNFLGFKIQRYSYVLPYKHRLQISVEEWLKSRRGASLVCTVSTQMASGENNLIILLKETADRLEFGAQMAHGWVTLGSISKKGYGATTWSGFQDAKLQANAKTPLFVFAANSGLVTSLNTKMNLEEIVTEYDLVVAVSAELLYD
jgi:TonB family protein